MQKLATKPIFLAVLVLLIAGCASKPKIHSVYDEGADFSSYKTYGFFANSDGAAYESFADKFIKAGIARNLQNRGLTLSDNPDLLVGYNIHKQEKIETRVSSTPATMGYYGYRSRYGYGYGAGYGGTTTDVSQYTEGTLNIDVVDKARKELIWEGVAVGRLKDKVPADAKQRVANLIDTIFAEYPVPLPIGE